MVKIVTRLDSDGSHFEVEIFKCDGSCQTYSTVSYLDLLDEILKLDDGDFLTIRRSSK